MERHVHPGGRVGEVEGKKVKAVRIFCDWCADAIWSASSIPNSTTKGFRISDALWWRIRRWQRWYKSRDPMLDVDGDPNYRYPTFEAADPIEVEVKEGLALGNAARP